MKKGFIVVIILFVIMLVFAMIDFDNQFYSKNIFVSKLPNCNSSPLKIDYINEENFDNSADAKKVKVVQQWNNCFGGWTMLNNKLPESSVGINYRGEFKEGKLNGRGIMEFLNKNKKITRTIFGIFADGELIKKLDPYQFANGTKYGLKFYNE